jgi:hypothetical protein
MFCPFLSGPRHTGVKCIGDACACWRIAPPTTPETGAQRAIVAENTTAQREEEAGPKPSTVPPGWDFVPYDEENLFPAGWVEPVEQARKRLLGYCGIAGAPSWGDA